MTNESVRELLDQKVKEYNCPDFIPDDPITIPHAFDKKQDIEIAGLFAAVLAWGQRKTIINKSRELMARMDNAPHSFITGHSPSDLDQLAGFCHRTFNETDVLYFVHFLRKHYSGSDSLEDAFVPGKFISMEHALVHFREYFMDDEFAPMRTAKHVATPARKSACKRLNMFMRWMVRKDKVDFGIWKRIPVSALFCPCDLHVERVARKLGLITRKQVDWQTALELTAALRQFDPADPVKYDFALFGLGVDSRQNW